MREDRAVLVRPLGDDDEEWKDDFLAGVWGSGVVARRGELVDAGGLPGFVAVDDGRPVGLLTYAAVGDEIEVVTLQVEQEGRGVGRALMDAVAARAGQTGTRRIWLITTNDNIRAISFYQQWGMDLAGYGRDAVDVSRALKRSIPTIGQRGIRVRHELEFELRLG